MRNIAVIGCGYWGKNHVRIFDQLKALHTLCDSNQSLLAEFKKKYPEIDIQTDFDCVLKNPKIKALVICTPAETHFTLAQKAMVAGKDVFIEKPLSLKLEDAEGLIETAQEQQRVLMVGHLLQYHPVFLRLKKICQEDVLGKIQYIYSNRLSLGKIRKEENSLWSFAPHDISMILSLNPSQPVRVMCQGGNYLDSKISDVTNTHIEFEDKTHAQIFVSWLNPFKEHKLVVVGQKAMAVFNDTLEWSKKLEILPYQINYELNTPAIHKATSYFEKIEEQEPLLNECQTFLNCLQTRKFPPSDGQEGLRVLKILQAAQESLSTNKVVAL